MFFDKKQYAILGMAVCVIVGFGAFRYYPLAKRAKVVKQAESEHLAAIEKDKVYIQKLPIFRQQIKELREKTKNFDAGIPANRNFAPLWQRIANIMKKHDLQEQSVTPDKEIQGTRLNCIPITLQCSGSLAQIFKLFESLEGFERVIRIEGLKLQNDKDLSGRINMEANAMVYYQLTETRSI